MVTNTRNLLLAKIKYPDSMPQGIPPRQASSKSLTESGYESDRNSGQQRAPERPDRPDRPDRRHTQRPASPATFGAPERQGSMGNMSISQQTSQLINPQLGQRPLTTLGTPPPRGASSGFQNNMSNSDYQAEGLSIATRRQTLKDDFQGGYGGAVVGTASAVNNPNANRRTIHQVPSTPTSAGPAPSPLRVINVSPSSPPSTPRQAHAGVASDDVNGRPDRRNTNFVPPPPPSAGAPDLVEEDINPYAMEAITPSQNSSGPYVPPPGPPSVASGPISPPPPPPTSAVGAPSSPSLQPPSMGNVMRSGNLPPPPSTPSPPVSGSIPLPPGSERKANPPPPPPHSIGSSTPIPGPLDRSSSPAPPPGRFAGRGSGGSALPAAPSSPVISSDSTNARTSGSDLIKIKSLESKAGAALEENELLRQQAKEREMEIEKMKKREHWLLTEVIMARAAKSGSDGSSESNQLLQDRRLSMADLEQELENENLQGQQLKLTQALVRVREQLRSAKVNDPVIFPCYFCVCVSLYCQC